MPRYTAFQRAYVKVSIDANDPDDALKKLAKWIPANRCKEFGRKAITVLMPGVPFNLIDQHMEPQPVPHKLSPSV